MCVLHCAHRMALGCSCLHPIAGPANFISFDAAHEIAPQTANHERKITAVILCKAVGSSGGCVVNLLNLNDAEFHLEFENAARAHQSCAIGILHFINDCERRKSFLDLGYSSIFNYLVRKVKYSSSTAGRLIQAARCIRENPEVLAMLEAREVSVTSITQVASILDDKNKPSILSKIKGASWREVERMARDYRPPVELRDRVAPVRVATADGARDMVFVQFLASDEYAELCDGVRRLSPGSMSLGEVSEMVLREYCDRHSPVSRQRRREARKGSASLDSHRRECDNTIPPSRDIPDEVRDAVWLRDGGQCTFVAPDGTRCGCKRSLEVDHIHPFANRGGHALSNLRLLCGGHNRLAAEQSMGRHVMRSYWRR